MASITASLLPPLCLQDRKTLFRTSQKPLVFYTGGRQKSTVIVKASGDSSESSTSLSIVKSVQNVWDKSDEDKVGLIGLGFAAIVALWTSTNVISAVDKLPIIPVVLEIIGILFSTWFVYRYLLFKPDRVYGVLESVDLGFQIKLF
ncbi:protein CURVATURE THYLAKOID 1C, chloroplastic-like isoform X2 [Hibiscus syriacus]|uniref:protein CURVATURE THYLAKOID 1C, chloroplastic-like isoform X2 n=1 Tax=Hibiscus syriacus TaxID=106335 RepID=UPI0019216256|nr:protein CURVATURE THYLAKOID 1C, chloroplastic-like isoform X2 [Hibiscus syriacus]